MKNASQQTITMKHLFSMQNLLQAWEAVSIKNAAPGIDGVTVDEFSRNVRSRLDVLQQGLLDGRYKPQPYIVFPKAKKSGGVRELVNSTVRDKVAARAAAFELNRCLDRQLMPQSYAYRPHKGALRAVRAVEHQLPACSHALRSDIDQFFDSMNHQVLARLLGEWGIDHDAVTYLISCAAADRFDGVSLRAMSKGVPQGSPLAPILSNLYLHPLDQALNDAGLRFVRYADDLLVLVGDSGRANGALNLIQQQVSQLSLSLSLDKTRVYPVDSGVAFLGFIFTRNGKTACREARTRLHYLQNSSRYADETEGEFIKRIEQVRRGWSNYYGQQALSDADEENSSYEGDDLPEDKKDVDGSWAIGEALSLRHQGRYGDAIVLLRRMLNAAEELLSDSQRKEASCQLADLYELQGLDGAANRCREAVGASVSPVQSCEDQVVFGPHDVEAWVTLFQAGKGPVAKQYVDATGRMGYRPTSSGLTAQLLKKHWDGYTTLAVPLYSSSDHVGFGVLDLDITRKTLGGLDEEGVVRLRRQLLDDAVGLVDRAHQCGVEGVIEDSGSKGYHVWFFFHQPIRARLVKCFLQRLIQLAGDPPTGTHRELFPASDRCPEEGCGNRIKLPLGVHRMTGNRCYFRCSDGTSAPLHDQVQFVRTRNRARQLKAAISQWDAPSVCSGKSVGLDEEASDVSVQKVEKACPVLAALIARAHTEHDLTHYERMVLRGILAPLGEAGLARAHAVFKCCSNYDAQTTDKMLRSASPHAMGCQRIREILGEFAERSGCYCQFKPGKNKYAHPLRHLKSASPSRTKANSKASSTPSRPNMRGEEKALDPDVELLVERYHTLRSALLEVQGALLKVCDEQGSFLLRTGTLRASGSDTDLRKWIIEL